MMKTHFKYLLLSLLLLTSIVNGQSQCPDYVATNSDQTCIGVAWINGGVPDPLPPFVFLGEQPYQYLAGEGTSIADLAVYTSDGNIGNPLECGLTITLFTGTLWIGEVECNYTDGVLPVTLIAFDGRQEGNSVMLNWSTSFEYQNRQFVVERSDNGMDWTAIGIVAGVGSTDAVIHYSFEDVFPIRGKNYYRLKQEDHGGSIEIFDIIHVTFDIHTVAFPNPFTDKLTIRGKFELLDSNGKQVVTGHDAVLDVSDLPAGMYIVRQGQTVEPVIKN